MKLVSIVGARPQFIKAAAISRSIKHGGERTAGIDEVIVHTGQHYDGNMSQVFFDELEIKPPKYNLGIRNEIPNRDDRKREMQARIEDVLAKEKPDWVIVYGDTDSTASGAAAAKEMNIPLAHVEAGLRSFNRRMPEEENRIFADKRSNLLFCPTDTAVSNLKNEGITKGVHRVGDVMYDSLLYYLKLAEERSNIDQKLKIKPGEYFLATIHRAENTDNFEHLKKILQALNELDLPVIFPVHPRTLKLIKGVELELLNIIMIEPVPYLDMLILEKNASIIFTDSGGVQKEAYFLKVPCVTLRNETEWVETVKSGKNVLAVVNDLDIKKAVEYVKDAKDKPFPGFYGDGGSSHKILDMLLKMRRKGTFDSSDRIDILGCPVDNLSLEESVKRIEEFIKSGKPHQYIAINADKIVKMRKDPLLREIILNNDLNIVDGQPLMWVSKLFGTPVKQRYGGLDIVDAIAPVAAKKGYGIYFLGARQEIIEKVAEAYSARYPKLKISGRRNGYWNAGEEKEVVGKIKEAKPDVLFFAMSSPKKEIFLKEYLNEMGVPFVMGVGGAFDIIAGKTKRAPEWMQRIGMEWLFRVIQEPRRLWKRYLVGNTIFIWLVLKEFMALRILRKNREKPVNA